MLRANWRQNDDRIWDTPVRNVYYVAVDMKRSCRFIRFALADCHARSEQAQHRVDRYATHLVMYCGTLHPHVESRRHRDGLWLDAVIGMYGPLSCKRKLRVVNVFDPWARDRGQYYGLEWKPRSGAESDPAFKK